ncbi:cobyrinate a,c-diamide synthase [Nisaea denitrificans]|uniref:cobyrinate a,c-diamide synthase n=1 Tax=Nisaea denitrificans TaxID=390877 RepID=UPI0004209399|nr:cobyrinate a,c-diamide synthase [Nisaea denitrificans]
MSKGLIIAAPASGSGKTTVTLGLLRALRRKGIDVASSKIGPDYIDPAFHAAATGRACVNLDSWAMRPDTLSAQLSPKPALTIVEGVMGLFDGAHLGNAPAPLADGSTASLARLTGWPVLLVVDAARQAQSVAALVEGFARFDPDVRLAGVILNKVSSEKHEAMLRQALAKAGHAVLGAVRSDTQIARPSRHLGLVQAGEHPDLDAFLDAAADRMSDDLALDVIMEAASPRTTATGAAAVAPPLPPLGQRIAVARDAAFAFSYPHVLDGWRNAGAELSFFSPLGDEAPAPDVDAVFLPGGYPELHAARLAAATIFMEGLCAHARAGARIYGECGGYMTLGQTLTDADGVVHRMAGLLPHATSFAVPKRHLGYRIATMLADTPLGPAGSIWRGHEFHYAATAGATGSAPLFRITDASGSDLGEIGARIGTVFGSFMHLIDRSDA